MHLVTTRRRVSAVAKSCHCSAIRLLFEDTSKYTRLQGGKQVKNTKKLHEKLKMEERKEGRMNGRGFPATAGRSLARQVSFYFRPPFSFLLFLARSLLCGLIPVTFQFAVAPPGPLQFGRLRSVAGKWRLLLLLLLPPSHEKFQVITLIMYSTMALAFSWVWDLWVPTTALCLGVMGRRREAQQAWFNCISFSLA